MSDLDFLPQRPARRPLVQRLGTVLWPSFLAAALATGAFFAFVDPLQLRDITFPDHSLSRELGYTGGFFMFWAVTTLSSGLTSFLQRPLQAGDEGENEQDTLE
ncbi:hypothetical protein [Stenotrophomonas sp. Marseille-Q4652]|uniref:hypothetical protein n=1 Tax=Stenotrophomonas sp. Marseille-Q4652 TaxID=2866595 RepID=UPI001CE42E5A|nr:hypothetical protein [Stenotrophomonas sp. Marseille-Q4652]